MMEIVILLYKGFTALDVVGPYEVLSRLPKVCVKFAAKKKGIIESENPDMKMVATCSLDEINTADILVVPGSTTGFLGAIKDPDILQQIQRINHSTKWTTSVCTGSILLAAAGILKGLHATTHWAAFAMLEKFGAKPLSDRFVREGKIITAAGVSAGIDMALFLTELIKDRSYAEMVQAVIEYYPKLPTGYSFFTDVPDDVKISSRIFLKKEMEKAGLHLIS